MVEKAEAGEAHGDAILISGCDNVVIPDGAAGLDDIGDAGAAGPLHVIPEGEEGVAAHGDTGDPGEVRPLLRRRQGPGTGCEGLLPASLRQEGVLLLPG